MKPAVQNSAKPSVRMRSDVSRRIRQHCRSSMKAEVCGVLIGEQRSGVLEVTDCIAGVNAAQGGAHVTFTQDAWEHIYRVKDRDFPNDRIVGWYHSHPGFGVFLSEHDEFIQKNFFSAADQVAWVHDPHTDEEGCFGWVNGGIERLRDVMLRDDGMDTSKSPVAEHNGYLDDDDEPARETKPLPRESKQNAAKEISLASILSHIALALLGVTLGLYFGMRRGYAEGAEDGLQRGGLMGAIEEYRTHFVEHNLDRIPPELLGAPPAPGSGVTLQFPPAQTNAPANQNPAAPAGKQGGKP